MRGRGGWTRAGARGIRERRRGGEGECMQKGRDKLRLCQDGGEGVELVQVVTMVGAGVSVAVVKLGSNMDVTGGRKQEYGWGGSSSN